MRTFKVIIALLLLFCLTFEPMTVFAADANTSEIDETPYRQVSGQEIADYAMYIATVLRPNYQLGHIAYNKKRFFVEFYIAIFAVFSHYFCILVKR